MLRMTSEEVYPHLLMEIVNRQDPQDPYDSLNKDLQDAEDDV